MPFPLAFDEKWLNRISERTPSMPSAMIAERPQTMSFRTPSLPTRRVGAVHGLTAGDSCAACRMRNEAFFCRMSDPAAREWDRLKHVTSYPEGALLTTNSEGKTFILKIAKPGQVFGLNSIVTGRPHEVTIETMQPSQFAYVSKDDFLRFIKDNGEACLRVVQQLGQECHSAYEVIRSLGLASSVSEKLAKFLVGWSAEGRESDGAVRVKLALTHEELAQLIGCSRESVTRTLSDFKRQKLVELNGSTLLVWNRTALETLAAV
jgi:CRP/FNR family transcriptional regulator, cyclic AMP receptor protein